MFMDKTKKSEGVKKEKLDGEFPLNKVEKKIRRGRRRKGRKKKKKKRLLIEPKLVTQTRYI